MSYIANHTGARLEPLSTAQGDNPTFTPGGQQTFSMQSLPYDNGAGLAYYVAGILFTVNGLCTPAAAGSPIFDDEFARFLIASFAIQGAWHGTQVSASNYLGQYAHILEFVLGGYAKIERSRNVITNAAATASRFNKKIFIPLSLGLGDKPHHTAQLALLFKNAQVVINAAPAATLTTFMAGATLTAMTCRASALLIPDPELRMGPPIEIVDYSTPAPSSGTALEFVDFGRSTGISGTENDSGVVFAALLSNLKGLGGACDFGSVVANTNNLQRFGAPFRDMPDTNDVGSFVAMQIAAMGPQRVIGSLNIGAVGQALNDPISDYSGYPYVMGADIGTGGDSGAFPVGTLAALPIVTPGHALELSKLQTVGGNIRLNATITTQTGTHHLLAAHARQWTPEKRELWRELVIREGLARRVLGDVQDFGQYQFETKLKNKQDAGMVDPKKFRYLPFRLSNRSDLRAVRT